MPNTTEQVITETITSAHNCALDIAIEAIDKFYDAGKFQLIELLKSLKQEIC